PAQYNHDLISPYNGTLTVNNTDPVSVTVISDANIRSGPLRFRDQVLHVFNYRRVRVVVGEPPVRLTIERYHLTSHAVQDFRHNSACSAVSRIYDCLDPPEPCIIKISKLFHHIFFIWVHYITVFNFSVFFRNCPLLSFNYLSQLLNVSAVNSIFPYADLEAVIFRRIMAAGDHY